MAIYTVVLLSKKLNNYSPIYLLAPENMQKKKTTRKRTITLDLEYQNTASLVELPIEARKKIQNSIHIKDICCFIFISILRQYVPLHLWSSIFQLMMPSLIPSNNMLFYLDNLLDFHLSRFYQDSAE